MNKRIFNEKDTSGLLVAKGKDKPTAKELEKAYNELKARRQAKIDEKKRKESVIGQYEDLLPKTKEGKVVFGEKPTPKETSDNKIVKKAFSDQSQYKSNPQPKPQKNTKEIMHRAAWDKKNYDREISKKPLTPAQIVANKARNTAEEYETLKKGTKPIDTMSDKFPQVTYNNSFNKKKENEEFYKNRLAEIEKAKQAKKAAYEQRKTAYYSPDNKIKRTIDDVTRKVQSYNTPDNMSKLKTGALIGAGVLGVGAIVANILKKRKWKKEGCKDIADPVKQNKCKQYVYNATSKDAQSECKFSNDPKKCHQMVMSRLKDLI